MGILQRIFGRPPETERRRLDWTAFDWRFTEAGMKAHAYVPPADLILSNLAVASRCVALRSEMLASVPLFLFRRDANGGRERADDNPLYSVLHDNPNPNQSAFEFREFMIRCLDLHGNAYARIERNARGQVVALWPYLYGDVEVEQLPNGRLRYRVFNGRRSEILLQEDCLHVRAASRDNIIGQSPITVARGALGLALSQNETAHSLSSNSLRPSGIVSFPQIMSAEQKTYFRENMDQMLAGATKAGRLVIVDAGAKFETVSFSPEDAQFLESRKLANEDICRIFGLPPTSVGITDKATYSNVEQELRNLVQNCIGPLAGRIEAAMQRCLLTDVGRRTLYVEHDLDGLLRGDVKSRFDAYRLARETGVFSANDIRRKENEPPIGPEGNVYHQPSNWVPLGTVPQQSAQGGAAA